MKNLSDIKEDSKGLTYMEKTSIKDNQPDSEGTMPISDEEASEQIGIDGLGAIGVTSLDDQSGSAFMVWARKLKELDERQPELGITAKVEEALSSDNPAAGIKELFDQYREQLQG
jgi:hypothetical protein